MLLRVELRSGAHVIIPEHGLDPAGSPWHVVVSCGGPLRSRGQLRARPGHAGSLCVSWPCRAVGAHHSGGPPDPGALRARSQPPAPPCSLPVMPSSQQQPKRKRQQFMCPGSSHGRNSLAPQLRLCT